MANELIPASEAAELLGWSLSKLHRFARVEKIPEGLKSNGLRGPRYFYRSDIEAELAKRETAVAS